MPLLYEAIAGFQGDEAASQLTLFPGDKLWVKDEGAVNLKEGWGWGQLVAVGQSGWFPSAYVKKVEEEALPIAEAFPVATTSPVDASVNGPATDTQAKWAGFKMDGSRLRNARNSIVSASNTAIQTATPHVQNACSAAQNIVTKGVETISGRNSTANTNNDNSVTTTQTVTRSGGWFNRTTTVTTTTTRPTPPSRGERMAGSVANIAAFTSISRLIDGNAKGAVKGAGLAAAALAVENNMAANRKSQRTSWLG